MRLLVAVMLLAGFAPAEAPWSYDFEDGAAPDLELSGATVTKKSAAVIDGRYSVVCDSRAGDYWNEFLKTGPGVELQRGRTYTVSFDYRIIDKTEPRSQMYCMVRSRSLGHSDEADIYGGFWSREVGGTDHVDFIFRLEKADDYYIMIGLRQAGVVSVDNLQIVQSGLRPAGAGQSVKNVYGADLPVPRAAARLQQMYERDRMRVLLDDMLVITLDEGAHQKADVRKDEIAEEMVPDFIDWNDIGPLAKDYGIRTSGGALEYQEYYRFEGEDVWADRWRLFVDNGFGRLLFGGIYQNETWGEGGYYTSHVERGWHDYYLRRTLVSVDKYASICQDNIGCATFHHGKASFSAQADVMFARHLSERYTAEELAGWGVEDVREFAVRRYICRMGNLGRTALVDPVVREYVKWRYVKEAEAWADCVLKFKQHAAGQGRLLPVYGNQSGAGGWWPFAILLSQFNDAATFEEILGVRDEVGRVARTYKLLMASGRFERPVWVRGPVEDKTAEKMPVLSTSYWRVHFAEALANGGVRAMSLGFNRPWTGDPETLDYIDDEDLFQLYLDTARFIDAHRGLFTRRESVCRVALVYSLASAIWGSFGPLGMEVPATYTSFRDTTDLLDSLHVPYDALIFGHPELYADADHLARLSRYKVVILPTVECITPSQLQALEGFVASGGVVLYAGEMPRFDENHNILPEDAVSAVSGLGALGLSADAEGARSALLGASNLNTDLPAGVLGNVWRSLDGDMLAVHLVNYDADVKGERISRKANVRVAVDAPPGASGFSRAMVYRPEGRPTEVTFGRQSGKLTAVVPVLDAYAVLAFQKGDAVDRATRESRKRREEDRRRVRIEAHKHDLY